MNATNLIAPIFKPILKSILKYEFLHYWFKGGRMSTKSSFISIVLVLLMVLDPEFNCVCLRKVAETLRESVFNQINWAIDKLGLNAYFKTTLSPLKIEYHTGQAFYFRGCDDPRKIKSIKVKVGKLKAGWFEELDEFSGTKEVRKVTQSIIRGGDKFVMLYSFNPPPDAHNWVNYEVESPQENRLVHSSTYLDVPREWLGEEAIAEAELLKKFKPDDYDNEYLGLTSKSSLNVVKYWTEENEKPITYQQDIPIHITTDFNVDPMCWLIFHKTEDKLFYFDEIVIENTTTRECAEEFCNRYPNHQGKIIINGDASGTSRSTQSELHNYLLIRKTLERHGYTDIEFNLRPWNPRIKNRILAFNNRVLTNDGKRCILVDPNRCPKLLYNIKYLKYKEGTSTIDAPTASMIAKDRQLKFLVHSFDSASYPAEYYYPVVIEHQDEPQQPKTIIQQWKGQQ